MSGVGIGGGDGAGSRGWGDCGGGILGGGRSANCHQLWLELSHGGHHILFNLFPHLT